jgi:hypothetical protein
LQLANGKGNSKKVHKAPSIVTASTKESNVSDLTGTSITSCSKNISDGASASAKSVKVSVASGRKQVQP